LARHVDSNNDNDDINETWIHLKNAITQSADAISKRTEKHGLQ